MKHKDLIIKWANGAKIEVFVANKWQLCPDPYWTDEMQFREHIPARNAFEAGKKVLARDENEWTRLNKLSDFELNWDEYAIVESDAYWKDKYDRGSKLEFCFFGRYEWIPLTVAFDWVYNSAYKFRVVQEPLVRLNSINRTTEGCIVRTEIPLEFYNLNTNEVTVKIDLKTCSAKIIS